MKWSAKMTDEEFVDFHDIRPVLKRLPGNLKAFSVPLANSFRVVINDALGPVERQEALSHELDHIRNGDHFDEDYQEYA